MINNIPSTFNDYKENWAFAKTAYNAMDGFYNGSLLDKYPRETDKKYSNRQKIAYYTNMFAPIVNRYVGYLFKRKPVRNIISNGSIIDQILQDVDIKGNNMDVFMSNLAKNVKVRGVGIVLVDNFNDIDTVTYADQIKERKFPYLVEIAPENVDSYVLDKFNKFEQITINSSIEVIDNDGTVQIKQIKTTYTKDAWIIDDGDTVTTNPHNLGECPVLYVSENGEFKCVGEFTSIAHLNKRHYNLTSELDEQLRANTFNMLAINANDPKADFSLKLGTDNALYYGRDLQAPKYIAPDIAPATIYQDRIAYIESTIKDIGYDIKTSKSAESGIALSLKFEGLNASLSNFAMRLNNLENRIFKVIGKYLGIGDNYIDVIYPKSFDIRDVEKEIGVLTEFKDLGYNVPSYERAKLLQIISNDLNTTDTEVIDNIKKEIEIDLEGQPD